MYVNHVNTLRKSWKYVPETDDLIWKSCLREKIYLVCSGFELAEAFLFFPNHCSCGEIAEGMPRIIRPWSDNQKRNSSRVLRCFSP